MPEALCLRYAAEASERGLERGISALSVNRTNPGEDPPV